MSNEIDTRVVEMQFDNQQFESGVQTSVKSLDNLKEGLNLDAATKSLENLGQVGNSFSLAGISEGVDLIAEKFTTLGIIGITMLQNITNAAIDAGMALVKSFTITPITSGWDKYEKKTIAVQTILSATGKTMEEVETQLQKLTWFTDETSYSFTDMVNTVGKFTSAGVELETAVTAMEGIATWAALSGANTETASRAMYQLAQAIGSGTVKVQDWMSIEMANMATEEFKNTAIDTAKAMGMLSAVTGRTSKGIAVTSENFRTTLQDGWFSKDVLLASLKEYGEYTDKLYQMTLDLGISTTEAMALLDKTGMALSAKAFEAARVARTFTDVVRATIDAVSSGWMQTFEILFGNFVEAKDLWTELALTLWDIFASGKEARNAILQDWKDLGGRTELIDALRLAYQKMLTVLSPIQEALTEMFPPITGVRLMEFTDSLMALVTNFKIGDETAANLKSTFKGFFAVLDMGKQAFTALAKGAGALITFLFPAVDGLLGVTGSIGEVLVSFDEAIRSSNIFGVIIETFSGVLQRVGKGIKSAIDVICEAFNSLGDFDLGPLNAFADDIQKKFDPIGKIGEILGSVFSTLVKVIEWVVPRIFKLADNIGQALTRLGTRISDAFNSGGFNAVAQLFNSGLMAGILLGIQKFIDAFVGLSTVEGGVLNRITAIFTGLKDNLSANLNQIKVKQVLDIAIALGILAAALWVLSSIDPIKLTAALAALSVLFVELLGSLNLFDKAMTGAGMMAMGKTTLVLIGVSVAMLILASAVTKLSKIDATGLVQGLIGVGILLKELSIFMKQTDLSGMGIAKGVGLLIMATAIAVLAGAVAKLSTIDLPGLAQGLAGVGILLGELSIFMQKTDLSGIGVGKGTGLLIMAAAIAVLAGAVYKLSSLNLPGLAQGLAAVGILLGEVSIFMQKTNLSGMGVAKGVGLLIMAAAIAVLAVAVQKLSTIDLPALAQGLAAIGILLGEVAIFMNKTTIGLKGAAALLIISGSLIVLAVALKIFAGMSLAELGQGLLIVAGMFVLFGIAGYALAPVVPVLLALAGAIALFGLGCLAVGAGVVAFAAGLTALAVAGAGGAAALVLIVTSIIGLIPMALRMMAEGVIAFAEVITRGSPAIITAITTLAIGLMDAIIKMAPKIMETLAVLLASLIILCNQSVPQFVDAALKLIIGFLKGLRDNMKDIAVAGAELIVNLIEGISSTIGIVIQAAIDLVVAFINGLADGIRNNAQPVIDAGLNLLGALIEAVIEFVLSPVKGVFTIGQAIVTGIQNGIKSMFPSLVATGADLGSTVINATKDRLDSESPSKEFAKIGTYIGSGLASGIVKATPKAVNAATNMANAALEATRDTLDSHSDSWKTYVEGENYVGGYASGIDDSLPAAVNSARTMAKSTTKAVVDVAKEAFDASRAWIDEEKYYNRMSLNDELLAWQSIQQQYLEGTEQRMAANREVYRVEQALMKEGYNFSRNWIDERKYYNELSLNDELSAWERVQARYSEGTIERIAADKEVYRVERSLIQAGYDFSRTWIDDQKYYNKLSLADELSAWERVQARYLEGTIERIAADKEVYRVKQSIIQDGYNFSRNWIDEEKYYNRLSQNDELAAWKRIQVRYLEGSEERKTANREVYRLEQSLNQAHETYSQNVIDVAKSANTQRVQLEKDYYVVAKQINDQLVLDIQSVTDEYDNAVKSRANSLYNSYRLFDKIETPEAIDGVTLIANLQEQNKAFETWQTNLSQLSTKGVDAKLISELQTMGPQSAAQVKALTNLTEPQLDLYVALWQTKHAEATSQATSELDYLKTETHTKITELTAQSVLDLEELRTNWMSEMQTLSDDTITQLSTLKTNWLKEIGRLSTASQTAFATLADGIVTTMKTPDWLGVGVNIVSGMTEGITSQAGTLAVAATDAAILALQAVNDALGIHSPSKEFEKVGMYSVMGLVSGLKNFANLAVAQATNVGTSTVGALQTAISHISDVINSNIDMTPTIRPVLDLTNVISGSKSIDALMVTDASLMAKGANSRVISIARDMQTTKSSDPVSIFSQADLDILHKLATDANADKPDMTATIVIDQPINLDGRVVSKNNSRHQAKFNSAKARALGVSV